MITECAQTGCVEVPLKFNIETTSLFEMEVYDLWNMCNRQQLFYFIFRCIGNYYIYVEID